jgi:hypothetical protein
MTRNHLGGYSRVGTDQCLGTIEPLIGRQRRSCRKAEFSPFPTEQEDTVLFTSPPPGEDGRRPGEGDAAMPSMLGPDLGGSQQGEGEASTEPASALRLCSVRAVGSHGGSPSRTHSSTGESPPDQQMPGNSLELVVSSVSVTVERGHTLERQSSVQVLSRLASIAKLFRSADGRFCTRFPLVIASR